jgi:hypothetical protein
MIDKFDCGSRSTISTRRPISANIQAEWYTSDVLPTPPLLLKNARLIIATRPHG